MTRSSKPAAPKRPKLATLAQRVSVADLSIATSRTAGIDVSWRDRKSSSTQRGYGYRWQQERKAFLALHPLCVMCEEEGRVIVATVVDHAIPHRGDQTLFWRRSNWRAICKPHHDSDAQKKDNALANGGPL